MGEGQEVTDERRSVDDGHAQQLIEMLGLQQGKDDAAGIQHNKRFVDETNADAVLVAVDDEMGCANHCQQQNEAKGDEVVDVDAVELEKGLKMES